MKKAAFIITQETLWLILAALFTGVILFPLYQTLQISLLHFNALLIFLFPILFRYILFFRKTPYLASLWVQVCMLLLMPWLLYLIMGHTRLFLEMLDTYDIDTFFIDSDTTRHQLEKIQSNFLYFKKEFVFFSTGTMLLMIIFMMRTVAALWMRLRSKEQGY